MSLLHELQRRNVIRVATAYVVTAWLVIQVIETIFPAFGSGDESVRIAVVLLGIGFIPVVIGAWVFEWTPEGLKRDAGSAAAPGSSRKFDRGIIAVLVVAVSFFAFDKFVLAPERAAEREAEVAEQAVEEARKGFYGDRSIAVLPFENLSADPEQVYFVDGVAEEILNLLAQIRDLRVISRASSFALRDEQHEIPEIAERLGVAHVLQGSVRRSGDRVRVTAQLIDAGSDAHLWSKTYERGLDDVFRIQDEIAADIVRNLEITLDQPLPRSRRVDPEVLALVQQAKQILEELRVDEVGQAKSLLERALVVDPDYVPAIELLGGVYWFEMRSGKISDAERREKIDELLGRVSRIDPNSVLLTGARAWEQFEQGDWENAARSYEELLNRGTNDSLKIRNTAQFAEVIGRFDVAARIYRYALAVDPLCHQCRRHYSRVLLYSGDYKQAIDIRERYLMSARGGLPDYALMLLLADRADEAYEIGLSFGPETPLGAAYTAMADFTLGRVAEAQKKLDYLLSFRGRAADIDGRSDERYLAYTTAYLAAWMGKIELAFELLFEIARKDDLTVQRELGSPAWDELRDDPRWTEFREAIGMSKERLDAIEFDPWLPE